MYPENSKARAAFDKRLWKKGVEHFENIKQFCNSKYALFSLEITILTVTVSVLVI